MARQLLSGFRLRIGDTNNNPPEVEGLPYRLRFFDSSTTQPKAVFNGPDDTDSSLGVAVNLDAEGYVPVSGIWLDPGRYNIQVRYALIPNPVDDETDWETLYTMEKVEGGSSTSTGGSGSTIVTNTVAAIRALSGENLNGMAFNTGYYTRNDGGQGAWSWDGASLESDDGGSSLLPTGQSALIPGRWLRLFTTDGEVSVKLWGAVTGQADVSGNIEAADLWCGRTSDDTGVTLTFPAGTYSIGGAVLELSREGLREDSSPTPVSYHFYENASFVGNGEVHLLGPAKIDSTKRIMNSLYLGDSNVKGGICRPEWWGAKGDGVTNDTVSFISCWERGGLHAVELTGTYSIAATLDVERAEKPMLYFRGTSTIDFRYDELLFDVGKVIADNDTAKFTGALGGVRLGTHTYNSSWFEFTPAKLELFCTNNNTPAAMNWNSALAFDEDTYSFEGLLQHRIVFGGSWILDNAYVTVDYMDGSDLAYFFIFTGGASDTGAIRINNTEEYEPSWFNAVGASREVELYHLLRNCLYSGKNCDFRNRSVSIDSDVTITESQSNTTIISNLNLTCTTAGADGLVFISSGSTVSFVGGFIQGNGAGSSDNVILAAVTSFNMRNTTLLYGNLSVAATNGLVDNNEFLKNTLYITGRGTGLVGQSYTNNHFVGCSIGLLAESGALQSVTIAKNRFEERDLVADDSAFIYLIPNTTACTMNRIRIMDNRYEYTGYDVANSTKNDISKLMRTVLDTCDDLTSKWDPETTMDIVVSDTDQVSATYIWDTVRGELNTSFAYSTYVLTCNTQGQFSESHEFTSSSAIAGQYIGVFEAQLILNGRGGHLTSHGVSAVLKSDSVLPNGIQNAGVVLFTDHQEISSGSTGDGIYRQNDALYLGYHCTNGAPFTTVAGTKYLILTGSFFKGWIGFPTS